jgi:uncharacterized protein (DUF2236 family)
VTDFFPRDSVIRRVSAEPAIMFGAGRALLLQLANPNVAQGVADHSDFQSNPFKRLRGTLEAVFAVAFGDEDLAHGVGDRIRWIHDHVTGPSYRANDPENLMWVHATLIDTALLCYERLVRPLSRRDREAFYQEATRVAEVFGCPRDAQPADLAAFDAYFAEQVERLAVTDVTRRLVRDIIEPTLPMKLHVPLAAPLALHRSAAIGLTPPRLRDEMVLAWTDRDQRRLDRFFGLARRAFAVTPRAIRVAPVLGAHRVLLRQARRHVSEYRENQEASSV